ncbi:MAG TPA: hypothetical protein VD994_13850 [Prosthecobacter sp.]|nr:hypothetical protein [Prosthecobacter sp.]
MNRSLAFVLELAEEKGAYSTFYQRRDAGMIFPDGDAWDRWREAADALLFGAAKEEIRFAALTTQGRGMTSYGECTLIPGDKFVTHRVSFTEENTAQRLKSKGLRAGGAALFRPDELADWATRHLLSTAKAAPQVTTSTTTADFPALVLKPGATTDDDQFVEGHIYGPLTLRSFISCSLPSQSSRFRKSVIKGLAQKLQKLNIAVPSP